MIFGRNDRKIQYWLGDHNFVNYLNRTVLLKLDVGEIVELILDSARSTVAVRHSGGEKGSDLRVPPGARVRVVSWA